MSSSAIKAVVAGVAVALLAGGALALWTQRAQGPERMTLRLPGADGRREPVVETAPAGGQGRLVKMDGQPAETPADWPHFRGPARDNISPEQVPLARSWPASRPPELWRIDVGEGYAAPAVRNGRVYLIDYDGATYEDVIRCLSPADGRDLWQYRYPVKVKRNHGMSRTIPAVTDKYVVTLGPKCHLVCLDAITGEPVWQIDLVATFGTEVPAWYAGQCPLIDGDRVIVAPGGPEALMVAIGLADGKAVWTTPNPGHWKMTHASIATMELGERKMYVYPATGGVVGVSAEDGKELLRTDQWKIGIANVPTPVPLGGGRILLTGGYNAGAMMIRLNSIAPGGSGGLDAQGNESPPNPRLPAGAISVETLWTLPWQKFGSHQQTPILYKGRIYGIRQDGQMVCLDPSGAILWESSPQHRFGMGPYLLADGMILILDDNGMLTAIETTDAGYRQIAAAKVLDGPEAWGPMAIVGGRLLARDVHKMVCLDLRAKTAE